MLWRAGPPRGSVNSGWRRTRTPWPCDHQPVSSRRPGLPVSPSSAHVGRENGARRSRTATLAGPAAFHAAATPCRFTLLEMSKRKAEGTIPRRVSTPPVFETGPTPTVSSPSRSAFGGCYNREREQEQLIMDSFGASSIFNTSANAKTKTGRPERPTGVHSAYFSGVFAQTQRHRRPCEDRDELLGVRASVNMSRVSVQSDRMSSQKFRIDRSRTDICPVVSAPLVRNLADRSRPAFAASEATTASTTAQSLAMKVDVPKRPHVHALRGKNCTPFNDDFDDAPWCVFKLLGTTKRLRASRLFATPLLSRRSRIATAESQ